MLTHYNAHVNYFYAFSGLKNVTILVMRLIKFINITSKILLVGLLVHYILLPNLPQYQNKGMAWRLGGYPIIVSAIPLAYFIVRKFKGRHFKYPHLTDLLITLSVTIDMLGNTLNFYNGIVWWDDLMHVFLTIPWVISIGLVLRAYTKLPKLAVAGLAYGFGSFAHIVWEIAEYLTFVPNNPLEWPSAYRDTIGDLALSLVGSAIGAILITTVFWKIIDSKTVT